APARSEHTQEMGAREEQHFARQLPQAADNAVGPGRDLRDAFASWTAVAKNLPPRALLANFGRGPPLVLAVVPFDEVIVDDGPIAESGQLARPPRPLQRARENVIEGDAGKARTKSPRIAFAARRERQVGQPRMLARSAPLRLAVSGDIDLRQRLAQGD